MPHTVKQRHLRAFKPRVSGGTGQRPIREQHGQAYPRTRPLALDSPGRGGTCGNIFARILSCKFLGGMLYSYSLALPWSPYLSRNLPLSMLNLLRSLLRIPEIYTASKCRIRVLSSGTTLSLPKQSTNPGWMSSSAVDRRRFPGILPFFALWAEVVTVHLSSASKRSARYGCPRRVTGRSSSSSCEWMWFIRTW